MQPGGHAAGDGNAAVKHGLIPLLLASEPCPQAPWAVICLVLPDQDENELGFPAGLRSGLPRGGQPRSGVRGRAS